MREHLDRLEWLVGRLVRGGEAQIERRVTLRGYVLHEHDFGRFEVSGEAYLFKIDYYDLDMQCASPDPADITQTCRVLTVMRGDEW